MSDRLGSQAVADLVEVTYRQLDYWTRNGYISAAESGPGTGKPRRWSIEAVRQALVMAQLARLQVNFESCRGQLIAALKLLPNDGGWLLIDVFGDVSIDRDREPRIRTASIVVGIPSVEIAMELMKVAA